MEAIRTAGVADAPAVTALLWASRAAIPLNEDLDRAQFADWHAAHCRDGNYQVIDEGGDVVAAMLLLREEIYYLVVAQHGRRRGAGGALIRHAQAAFPRLAVKVAPANDDMQRLLAAHGFDRLGRNGGWVDWLWQARPAAPVQI